MELNDRWKNDNYDAERDLDHVRMFMASGNIPKAKEYLEKVLENAPECGDAYILRLLMDLGLKSTGELEDWAHSFEKNENYKKALQYAKDKKTGLWLERCSKRAAERAAEKRAVRIRLGAVAAVIAAAAIAAAPMLLREWRYVSASAMMSSGDYDGALKRLESIENYKDAGEKIEECLHAVEDGDYRSAEEQLAEGDYEGAIAEFQKLGDYKDSEYNIGICENAITIRDAVEGDIVEFGEYEQDNDAENGAEPIEWIVLEKDGNETLLISKKGLFCKPYNKYFTAVTWDICSLRSWLNETFYSAAFGEVEQSMILSSEVSPDSNPNYLTPSGSKTEDKVFLLSITEALQYFPTEEERVCEVTDYAVEKSKKTIKSGTATWWLRSPGYRSDYAAIVFLEGNVSYDGDNVSNSAGVVRPVIRIVTDKKNQ